MSRQVDASVQTEVSSNDLPNMDGLKCPVFLTFFFEPIMSVPCGHLIEEDAKNKLPTPGRCPCCRESVLTWMPCPPTFKEMLQKEFQRALTLKLVSYDDVYFNLDHFAEIVRKNEFNTPTGERFMRLLENATNHLNDRATEGAQRGKSAIKILSNTRAGRGLLRKNARICALISPESSQIQIEGIRIQDWLSTGIEVERDEQNARRMIETEAQQSQANFQRILRSQGLFAANSAAATTDQRPSHPAVDAILQQVVYGNKEAVRTALEELKTTNPELLKTVLISTATQPIIDYSNRSTIDQTLLQAAACAGDVAINPGEMEMCEMISSYLPADEIVAQFAKLFPRGVEAHDAEQQRNAFKFDRIIAAFRSANPADRQAALEAFRPEFTEISNNETVFNPYHLLRALEAYIAFWGHCVRDQTDQEYAKRDEFWCKIIGFIQRFLPACDAQAFAQGLLYLVKVDDVGQPESWRAERLRRSFNFKVGSGAYYPLVAGPLSGLGVDFAIYAPGGGRAGAARGVLASWGRGCVGFCFRNFCQTKTASYQNFMPREQSMSRTPEWRCVVQ